MDLDILSNYEFIPKILVGLSGLFAAILKIKSYFSTIKIKQSLKLELEIYDIIKKHNELDGTMLKEKIDHKINYIANYDGGEIMNFMIGLAVFIGFGLWSIDIYQSDPNFNAWIILTIFLSVIGLSMCIQGAEVKKNKSLPFMVINLYNKNDLWLHISITIAMLIITIILVFKMGQFSFWQILPFIFFWSGLFSLKRFIKKSSYKQ